MRIGVLAIQGDFAEHSAMFKRLGVETSEVRLPGQLEGIDGLVIPGGESTTIGKLATDFGLIEPIRTFSKRHALWGTCAGAIFMSKDVNRSQPLLNLMDIKVERNAFGRQVSSFEADLDIPELKLVTGTEASYHAVFIRAPIIESVTGNTKILAALPDGSIVAAQQDHLLATSFHPELTSDLRFHEFFLLLAKSAF